jgi:hypothetical protein
MSPMRREGGPAQPVYIINGGVGGAGSDPGAYGSTVGYTMESHLIDL